MAETEADTELKTEADRSTETEKNRDTGRQTETDRGREPGGQSESRRRTGTGCSALRSLGADRTALANSRILTTATP